MPENYRFGGGAADTTLTPIVLVILIVAMILIVILPRKYIIVPVMFTFFLVPAGQMILLAGYHLYIPRLVILFGCARAIFGSVTSKGPAVVGGWNWIDKAFFFSTITGSIAVILLFAQIPAVINQFGILLDYLGGYFVVRYFVRDEEDIFRALKCFAVLALIMGATMTVERVTLHNVFGYLGGSSSPAVQEDRVRAQGPFEHALMAGAFGSTLLPLFCLLWKNGKSRMLAAIGIVGATMMTWSTDSSTSLMAYTAGILAFCFWKLRKKMKMVRWGIVFGLIALQLVMKAPVWFLIARVDLTGGSSSYHRAELVDQFIRHFSDWWLIGTNDTINWGLDMWDAQNQYVSVGETGGLLALVFLIALISRSFARLGNARKLVDGDKQKEWFLWCLGAALFAHVVCFFGVNYFDQSRYAWFVLLAIISAATVPILQVQAADVPEVSVQSTLPRLGMPALPSPDSSRNRPYSIAGVVQRTN